MTELSALYRLAQRKQIAVDCFELKKREALSVMDRAGACFIAIDPFRLKGEEDERVKLGHELGHCVTGSFYNRWAARDVRQKHENRADKWAIRRLIPKDKLDDAVAAGHTELWELADCFGVTEDFMRKAVCLYVHGNLDAELYFCPLNPLGPNGLILRTS